MTQVEHSEVNSEIFLRILLHCRVFLAAAPDSRNCATLTLANFQSNAPPNDSGAFDQDPTTAYYLPGTSGWGQRSGTFPPN